MAQQRFEVFLSILMGRERAEEFTGDLVELHSGGWRFWWAAIRLVAALTWRPLAGITCAFLVFFLSLRPFASGWQQNGLGTLTGSQLLAAKFVSYSMPAWAIACLAIFRLGTRNSAGALSCVFAALLTVVSSMATEPSVQVAAMVVLPCILLLALFSVVSRNSIFILARCAFAVWLVRTGFDVVYGTLMHRYRAPHLLVGTTIPLMSLLFSFWVGWLALGSETKLGDSRDQPFAAISATAPGR